MKLAEVFRYELEHRLRSPSTWVYGVLLFGLALANAVEVSPLGAVNANAPRQVAFDATITGMIGLIVSVALFGDAALRDFDAGMDSLLFTQPQRTIDHLGGRYLAALAANALLLLTVPVGYALPTLVGYPNEAHFGPFRAQTVLQPLLLLLLPNLALSGALLFTVGVLSRRLIAVYITALVLFMGGLVLAELRWVGDPTGLGILQAMGDQWTAGEQNSQLMGSSTVLLLNRLFWLSVTAGVFMLLHKRFRYSHPDHGVARRAWRWPGVSSAQDDDREAARNSARGVLPGGVRTAPAFGLATSIRQARAIARRSLAEVAANPWFAVVLVVCIIWSLSLVEKSTQRPFDLPTWPVTMLVTAALSRDLLVGFFLLEGLYAGELVWKDRDTGAAEIADAAPVGEGTLFVGRFLALVGISAMFLAAAMLGGILGQLGGGYEHIEPALYLRTLFGLDLAEMALMTVLVLAVHVIVNHKHLGAIAVLLALIIPFTGKLLKYDLLVYNGDAGWIYSDMNGFGPFLESFVWLKLYSAAWALLLAIAASLLWVRGRAHGAAERLRQARERFTGRVRDTAVVALALIVTSGAFIFYNTNLLNAYDTTAEASAVQAKYDARYARFVNAPQPVVERATLRVEIYPERRSVDVRGTFHLHNRTGAPIDSIRVSTNPRLQTRAISLDRAATPVVVDSVLGYRVFALALPLAPGHSIALTFDVGLHERGFRSRDFQTSVVENGSYFGRGMLPAIGYRPASDRGEFTVRGEPNVEVDAIIGTAPDQIAITSGNVQREWMENGRRYFHYRTASPAPFEFPVLSARYAVRTDRWVDTTAGAAREVALRVYHHPEHNRNIDGFIRGMKASLSDSRSSARVDDTRELRLVEVPRYHREYGVHANLLVFSEGPFIARTTPERIADVFLGVMRGMR